MMSAGQGQVPTAVFQALWERLPCTGVLPVTTTTIIAIDDLQLLPPHHHHRQSRRPAKASHRHSSSSFSAALLLLQCVSDSIDHHVSLCTGQGHGLGLGQGAALGLPVVGMACRVQHHRHPRGSSRDVEVGPLVAWAMQTLWGECVALRINARARDRDRDGASSRSCGANGSEGGIGAWLSDEDGRDLGHLVVEVRCADEHTLAAILAGTSPNHHHQQQHQTNVPRQSN